ncbi:MAG: hypothetical protein JRJ87_19670 [Deltaproteobacteria bacterium]|nr:hypothetical protein [Deltaproteobacteria bacterium]
MSRTITSGLLAIFLVTAWTGLAQAQVHQRNGFTLELGIGPSAFQVFPSGHDKRYEFCPGVTISLGGFLNESMALMFHMHIAARTDGFSMEALSVAQLHFQYWFNDWVFLSSGAGMAIYSIGDAFQEAFLGTKGEEKTGFGLSLRTGFSFGNWENHSLRVALELVWCVFENMNALAETITFEWQWF